MIWKFSKKYRIRKEGKINGWLDYPLTDEAEEKIQIAATKLKDTISGIRFDEAYSSYLSRTYFTAQKILAKLHCSCEVVQDIRINERCYGAFQGMTRKEARLDKNYETLSNYPVDVTKRLAPMSDEDYMKLVKEYSQKLNICYKDAMTIVPRSESIAEVEERIAEFLEEILVRDNNKKNILVVSHANTVKLMAKYIENLDYLQTSKLRFAEWGLNLYDIQIKDNGSFFVNNIYRINDEYVG